MEMDIGDDTLKHEPKRKYRHGWTEKNVQIVEAWKVSLEEASFVFNDSAEYYEKMTQLVLILSLIIGSVMTVISALTITLGSLSNQWIVLGFNVGMLGGSVTIAFANSFEKIYSWDDKQKEYGKHTQKLYSLWLSLDAEMSLSSIQRFPAYDFIKRKIGEYAFLMQQGPYISMVDYNKSLHKYKNNIYNEEIWMVKFNKKRVIQV